MLKTPFSCLICSIYKTWTWLRNSFAGFFNKIICVKYNSGVLVKDL